MPLSSPLLPNNHRKRGWRPDHEPLRRCKIMVLKPAQEAGVRLTEGEAGTQRGQATYAGSQCSGATLNPEVACFQSLPASSEALTPLRTEGLTLDEQAATTQDQENTYFEVLLW